MSSNVTLAIAGRAYTIACAPGEEAHIAQLGESIGAKLSTIPNLQGQSAERTLLYAALLLADELHEAKASESDPAAAEEHAAALEGLADRLESLAKRLEEPVSNA